MGTIYILAKYGGKKIEKLYPRMTFTLGKALHNGLL
jgi:hypothetical protein